MALTSAPPLERRRSPRGEPPARFAINLLRANRPVAAGSLNMSDTGLCLRVQETLEVKSLVRLQLTPARPAVRARALQCTGRVIWVVQRLDLRGTPPFLYDIGIEFVDPPPPLRQLMAQRAGVLARPRSARGTGPAPALIRGRQYVPRLERTEAEAAPWHLVVALDDVPCFSSRYASSRAARAGWDQFRRRQARVRPSRSA